MKGIILAGGLGTRLHPLTKITNKHLLPLYDRPMIFFPIAKLAGAGIKEIIIVTGGNNAGDFLRLLGDGSQFGLRQLHYTYQPEEGGIAQAVGLCERYADGDKVAVMLGDNLIEQNLRAAISDFRKNGSGARIFLKKVSNPCEYGVAAFDGQKLRRILEKPKEPPSDYAVVGLYLYDNSVFDIVKTLKPSKRNELEISDVNNVYLKNGTLKYEKLKGRWADAGESLAAYNDAIAFARRIVEKEGKYLNRDVNSRSQLSTNRKRPE
jgi:glucose-1-phosphate thymidylyltransferase